MSAQILQFEKRTTKADWEKWLEDMRNIAEQVAENNREAAKSILDQHFFIDYV